MDAIVHDARGLVDRAAELGFDAIAITLHDRQLADPRLVDYARERGIVLIPGIERTVEGKHVLLINFPQAAEQVRTFADLAALRACSGGVVIAPHAFFPSRSCLHSLMQRHAGLFDAVEWSYFWTPSLNFNARAARWARENGKPIVGNSDLHDLRQLGRTYSHVAAERSADAICQAIREGEVSVKTTPVPAMELARVLGGMARRGTKARGTADAEVTRLATT